MKKVIILAAVLTLSACGTLTRQINVVHAQVTAKIETDFNSVKEVGIASKNQQLVDCADTVLTQQLPPLKALDQVQVTGIFSTIALTDAKAEALKFKQDVVVKCSVFPHLLVQFGLIR